MSNVKNPILNDLPYEDEVSPKDLPECYHWIRLGVPYDSYGEKNDELIANLFRNNLEKKTIAVFYDKDDQAIRSVYGMNGGITDEDEPFTHMMGDKLRRAELELGCTVSAYDVVEVLIPDGLSTSKIKAFLNDEVRYLVNSTDKTCFDPEWDSSEGLRIVEVVGNESTDSVSGPVDFHSGAVGYEVKSLVDAFSRSTHISPEVFMYLSAKSVKSSGGDVEDVFMDELREKAIKASNAIIEKHINEGQPLADDLMVIRDRPLNSEQVVYKNGNVLSGTVENVVDTEVFTDDSEEDHTNGDARGMREYFS